MAAAAKERATNGSRAWCPPVSIHGVSGKGVLGDEHGVEPGRLGGAGHLGDGRAGHELVQLSTRWVGSPSEIFMPAPLDGSAPELAAPYMTQLSTIGWSITTRSR